MRQKNVKYIFFESRWSVCHRSIIESWLFYSRCVGERLRLLAGLLPCQETEKDDISTLLPHSSLSHSLSVSVFPSHHALFICRELWIEMGKIIKEPLTLCIEDTECWRAVMRRPWVHLEQFLRKLICTSNLWGLKTDKHFISQAALQTRSMC